MLEALCALYLSVTPTPHFFSFSFLVELCNLSFCSFFFFFVGTEFDRDRNHGCPDQELCKTTKEKTYVQIQVVVLTMKKRELEGKLVIV